MLKKFRNAILGLALSWLGAMCCVVAVHECFALPRNMYSIVFCVAFVCGLALFWYRKFTAVYVFGHEMTHYLVAKLFGKKTGRMKIGAKAGYVEVKDCNIWITLAPYIFPLYVIVLVAIYGLVSLFYVSQQLDFAFVGCAAVAAAYHCVLTYFAISKSQEDLKMYGPFLSMSLIFAGNMLLFLLGVLIFSRTWSNAWFYATALMHAQVNILH